MTFDREKLKAGNYDDITMLVVLDQGNAKKITFVKDQDVVANKTEIAMIEQKERENHVERMWRSICSTEKSQKGMGENNRKFSIQSECNSTDLSDDGSGNAVQKTWVDGRRIRIEDE